MDECTVHWSRCTPRNSHHHFCGILSNGGIQCHYMQAADKISTWSDNQTLYTITTMTLSLTVAANVMFMCYLGTNSILILLMVKVHSFSSHVGKVISVLLLK